MKPQTPCPATALLQGLIEDSLPKKDEAALTAHLDSCSCCQEALERVATDGTALVDNVRAGAQDQPTPNSAYWPALNVLEQEATRVTPRPAPTPRPEVALDFLAPSDNAQHLGRLSHFDVVRVVGRGGMGVVLHGFDTHLQRDVALKVLDPQLARDEVARKRFCREARAAASITHENVVAVHHVEREEGLDLPFLVMQLVAGESLEDRIRRQGRLEL